MISFCYSLCKHIMINSDLSFDFFGFFKGLGEKVMILAVGGGNALCQFAIRCLTKQERRGNFSCLFFPGFSYIAGVLLLYELLSY